MKEEIIRDRIIVGIRDMALSQKLQLDPELTFEKAKTKVRQQEAVQEHQQMMKSDFKSSLPPSVDAIKKVKVKVPARPQHASVGRQYMQYRPRQDAPGQAPGKCSRCGKGSHSRLQCPAREAICHLCKKKGHFFSQCFSKSIPVQGVAVPEEGDTDVNTVM